MNEKKKIKQLTLLANQALSVAGEAWELADAYAGGDSEGADAIAKALDRLGAKLDKLTEDI
jgi:hypothetical protein